MATRVNGYTRRECFSVLGAAVALPYAQTGGRQSATAPVPATPKAMRGAFMILNTPFTESKAVDWDDLDDVAPTQLFRHC